jgi:hypothetical protein
MKRSLFVISRTFLAILIVFAAIKTNISMLSKAQGIEEVLGVLTGDFYFGMIIYY